MRDTRGKPRAARPSLRNRKSKGMTKPNITDRIAGDPGIVKQTTEDTVGDHALVQKARPVSDVLQAVHTQWALWTIRQLRFTRPELIMTLYGTDCKFTIHIANSDAEGFSDLVVFFNLNVRPASCDISLSRKVPQDRFIIKEVDNFEADLWLHGEPLPATIINSLASLAEPRLPEGNFDFDQKKNKFMFRSHIPLTADEQLLVQSTASKVGLVGTVHFILSDVPSEILTSPDMNFGIGDNLSLITSRYLEHDSRKIKDLLYQDEDEWRGFLSRRLTRDIVTNDSISPSKSACLYDVEHCGNSRLSELLTLYERVDVIPGRDSLDWCTKHNVPLHDLQELVRLKRVRLILPYSATHYPTTLVEAVAEVDQSAIVLSRALAAKTIEKGQKKEPFLFAPLTARERSAILSGLSQTITDPIYRGLLSSYGELFSRQHTMFMVHGALASLRVGVGAYVGNIFFILDNKDARVELATCGAGLEWALGLGASYVPRNFGEFDETRNSQIIASYLGRTNGLPADPVADRMHILSDGLLAVSNVPPLEVARNFHSTSAARFRNLARRLMSATPNVSELEEAVDRINADVKAFERRAKRLASWKLQVPIAAAAASAVEDSTVPAASVAAAWLYQVLKHKIPSGIRNEVGDAMAMLTGLATGTSLDAVVVSRSRKSLAEE